MTQFKGFPGYEGRFAVQNFICALFHSPELASATRKSDQPDILQAYGIDPRGDEKVFVVPAEGRHLATADIEKIFAYCEQMLLRVKPWPDGAPAVELTWKSRPAYGGDMLWPVQNLFNQFVNESAVAHTLLSGSDEEKSELFDRSGVPATDRALFAGLGALNQEKIHGIFARCLEEFKAERPTNIW